MIGIVENKEVKMNVVYKVVFLFVIFGLIFVIGCGLDLELVVSGKYYVCKFIDF